MRMKFRVVIRSSIVTLALLSAAIVVGCKGPAQTTEMPPETAAPAADSGVVVRQASVPALGDPLADTDWYLVEIQSMDDAVGTTRPVDPSMYTMRLNGDGTVNMRLNCNRANGTWTAEPSADPSNGSFVFGPLATTRALCPPPSLDEQIAAQAEYIRGFMLKDDRLYLSLMADGGIFVWEAQVPFETEPDAQLETAILQASPDYTKEIVEIDNRVARYLYSRFDLDGDGKEEVFVYMLGSVFCGSGGCTLMLFTDREDGYSLVNTFPISRTPIVVSAEKTKGWANLVRPESGGGASPSYVTHVFDGERYIEGGRMPADTTPEGTRCLAGDFTFDDGIPLKPRT